jgi:hypothetical protein
MKRTVMVCLARASCPSWSAIMKGCCDCRVCGGFLAFGEWLSLVEHLVRDQGVGGSNPLSPTNLFNGIHAILNFSFPPL